MDICNDKCAYERQKSPRGGTYHLLGVISGDCPEEPRSEQDFEESVVGLIVKNVGVPSGDG